MFWPKYWRPLLFIAAVAVGIFVAMLVLTPELDEQLSIPPRALGTLAAIIAVVAVVPVMGWIVLRGWSRRPDGSHSGKPDAQRRNEGA